MKNRYLYITLLSLLALNAEIHGQTGNKQIPRLIVNITIDQLQSDYLDFIAPSYGEGGFRKLLTEGLIFEKASYPFQNIDRSSAISTLVTGTTPFYHGIPSEQWIDRETLKRIYCTEDSDHPGIPSPIHLAVSTLSDELKMATNGKGRVFSIAPTEDAAILSAGHAADGAFWADLKNRRWRGSQYYSNASPLWLLNFNELRNSSKRRKKQQDAWLSKLNTEVTGLAVRCISDELLGQDSIPDLLYLTYDAGKNDQQTYVQLDQEIASLIGQIETKVMNGQTLYVITGTGYRQPIQTDYEKYRVPTGTFYINRTANLLNMYFGAIWGQGRYVEAYFQDQIYLNHKLLDSKHISLTDAAQRAREFIMQMAGVRQVSYCLYEQHKGDLQIEVAPGWHLQNEDTHEDQQTEKYGLQFPIIIYGTGITPERVKTPVSIDQIAPAIAKSIRIRAPNACTSEPLF